MRVTLDLDPHVLRAVNEIASAESTPADRVISNLLRKVLQLAPAPQIRNGVPLMPPMPPGSSPMTAELVEELLDEP